MKRDEQKQYICLQTSEGWTGSELVTLDSRSELDRRLFSATAESVKDRVTLLAQRRNVSANAAEVGSTFRAAKTPGHFLCDLEHAQVAFESQWRAQQAADVV